MKKTRPIDKRIEKDFRDFHSHANALFSLYSQEIGKHIEAANTDVVTSIAATLSMMPDITYQELHRNRTLDRLHAIIMHRYEACERRIQDYWVSKLKNFDLMSRLVVGMISRKTSPPWIKTRLNLKDDVSTDGGYDPRKGHLLFFFRNLTEALIKEIQRGALQGDTLNQVMSRVRRLFDRNDKQGVREAAMPPKDIQFSYDDFDPGIDKNHASFLANNMEVQEGFYSVEDLQQLKQDMIEAQKWQSRQYRPWFTDELKANNRYLRDLEQFLNYNATYAVQNGLVQVGPEEMGIKDMVWAVHHPQDKCDECTKRDGLTMKEIKAKMKDEFRDAPPPLHPACRCQLIPYIQDEWADKYLKDGDEEFDPDTTIVFNARDEQKKYGIRDMTFNEFLRMAGSI